jgi:hypothetical protein
LDKRGSEFIKYLDGTTGAVESNFRERWTGATFEEEDIMLCSHYITLKMQRDTNGFAVLRKLLNILWENLRGCFN